LLFPGSGSLKRK
jgi:hypothetical protein